MATMTEINPDAIDRIFTNLVDSLRRMGTISSATRPSTEATEINVDLLRRTLEYVTENPELHDQDVWAQKVDNRVVGCLAYHATHLAGHTATWAREWTNGPGDRTGYVVAPKGPYGVRHMKDVAQTELGLTPCQASRLFYHGNRLADLWELAEQFTNGEISRKDNA